MHLPTCRESRPKKTIYLWVEKDQRNKSPQTKFMKASMPRELLLQTFSPGNQSWEIEENIVPLFIPLDFTDRHIWQGGAWGWCGKNSYLLLVFARCLRSSSLTTVWEWTESSQWGSWLGCCQSPLVVLLVGLRMKYTWDRLTGKNNQI